MHGATVANSETLFHKDALGNTPTIIKKNIPTKFDEDCINGMDFIKFQLPQTSPDTVRRAKFSLHSIHILYFARDCTRS